MPWDTLEVSLVGDGHTAQSDGPWYTGFVLGCEPSKMHN